MLHVIIPPSCAMERTWIVSLILGEFLGLPFTMEISGDIDPMIRCSNRTLTLPDTFFHRAAAYWLEPSSLPERQLAEWNVADSGLEANVADDAIPVLFGRPGFLMKDPDHGHLNVDIFGSAFFMLSRYEEAVLPDRDVHDRFPVEVSTAYQAGFLARPLVDEYVEILWAAIKRVWPELQRKPRQPRVRASCDVDCPYSQNVKSLRMTVRNVAGDLIKRRSATRAIRTGLNALCFPLGYDRFDPLNTFDWIMETNERAGNRVAFYFFADRSSADMDGSYNIEEPPVRALLRRIHERGHEIGLHGSYHSYLDESQHKKEASILRKVMEREGIDQPELGNRQHYLRWRMPETARNLEKAGISYDTTLGYANCPGFRCGTSYSYPMYDLKERKPLTLRQYPLILMEDAVIDKDHFDADFGDKALNLMLDLKRRSLQFGGNFSVLWHNDSLEHEKARQMYQMLVA